ncbi:MAG: helix-turn-helix domain-containing protein [Acetobacteraceae bacterium]|nr:helix-turn-helix domain-containing protein [Acetobacteraceae bacterium]
MTEPAPVAYTVRDAARVAGISRSQLYELFAAGKLTPRRCGRRTLVLANELEAFLRELPPAPIRRRKSNPAT